MRLFTTLPAPLLPLLASATFALESPPESSGLQIENTAPVTCSRPSQSGDAISVHYKGTLQATGAEFDESYKRGAPFTFTLGEHRVIEGWDLGLLDMCPGELRKLIIPPELGYGDTDMGAIPPGSTLVFETELVDIVGVKQEELTFATTSGVATATEDNTVSIATAPPVPPTDDKLDHDAVEEDTGVTPQAAPERQAECHLLGPFALVVQGALGAVALLTLVLKRYRETPKRPWKIWFFDVSKQVFGSMLTHVLNLAMSMLSSVDMVNAAAKVGTESAKTDPEGRTPNPCSFYLLNLGIDTTIGVPVLYLLLKILHALFLRTALANPPDSIKSGNYGRPPQVTWYLKQLFIYCIGLVGMKLFVLFLFTVLPWLPWIGDWALRWTNGNEALEVSFALFIFPLIMNAVQYWVIDNFIMDKHKEGQGYEAVRGENDDDDHDSVFDVGDDSSLTPDEVDVLGKAQVEDEPLKEANPTPLPASERQSGEGTQREAPVKEREEGHA